MNSLLSDLRYGIRMMGKAPGFTLVAVIVLAIGIGANTAIFSVVNVVLLRPLPFEDPKQVVFVDRAADKGGFSGIEGREFLEWQDQAQTLDRVAAYSEDNFNLSGGGEPERVSCARVSASLFPLLGVNPLIGRTFSQDEDRPGHNQVAVVSQALWQRRFGSASSLDGQSLTLDNKSYAVVGVMPAGFEYPPGHEIWLPIALDPIQERTGEFWSIVNVVGRLKRDTSIQSAQAELTAISGRLPNDGPGAGAENARLEVMPLHEHLVKDVRLAVLVLLGAVGFVLLIACANVGNLMLARAAARRKEMGIRVAVGAGRWRLVRQLLTESLLIALLGGLAGVLLALWGVDFLVAAVPSDLAGKIHGLNRVAVDGRALGFTLGLSILTGVVFGLAPALVSSKPDLAEVLKQTGRHTGAGYGLKSLRGGMVVAELALAVVLLAGAGLLIRSFVRLLEVRPGFRSENVLTMRVELPRSKYPEPKEAARFFQQVLERAGSLPGVERVGAVSDRPLKGFSLVAFFEVEGSQRPKPGHDQPVVVGVASPDYFRAMGIPLLSGRFFDERDNQDSSNAVLINQAMARRFFSDRDPIGKSIGFGCKDGLCRKIVGVVGDMMLEGPSEGFRAEAYLPYLQFPMNSMTLILHTATDPLRLVGAVRGQVLEVDKDQPVSDVMTMEQRLSESVAQPRMIMVLLGTFAGLALILATVGIYGMISYTVAGRTQEIGVRMALGARRGDVLKLVLGQAAVLAFAGTAIGLAAAAALTRVMSSLLFQVSATDPLTFAAISLLLVGVALGACFVPARRATKIDPMIALRYE